MPNKGFTLPTGLKAGPLTIDATTGAISTSGNVRVTGAGQFVGTNAPGGAPSPAPSPTYAIAANTTAVNEGSAVLFTVTTTNVANNTVLYWTTNSVTGTVNASDFSDSATSGNVTISNNTATFTRTMAADLTTEGSESFAIQLRTDSTSGTVQATSGNVTVADTSLSPVYADSYSLTGTYGGVNLTGAILRSKYQTTVNGETRTFYYLDRNGDGANSTADQISHADLQRIFTNNASGTGQGDMSALTANLSLVGGGTVTVMLPTMPTPGDSVINLVNNSAANLTTDLAAIWDSVANANGANGSPPGWASTTAYYWSATPYIKNYHGLLYMSVGRVSQSGDINLNYAALRVIL